MITKPIFSTRVQISFSLFLPSLPDEPHCARGIQRQSFGEFTVTVMAVDKRLVGK